MKKLLLVATTSAAILSSVASFADDGEFYLRAGAGASIFDKQKDKPTGLKMKANTVFIGEIGVGYYVMDNVRADVTLSMAANPQLKKSGTINGFAAAVKHKGKTSSLLVNAYVDVLDVSITKIFIGGGVGASYLKEKISATIADRSGSISTKKKYDFAWQASVGASAEVAEGVKGELIYSYRGYGKTKSVSANVPGLGAVSEGGTKYQGNNIMVGVRFDI